jgi:hypothetical protein
MIGFCIAAAVVAVYVLMFACCVAAGRADEAIEREMAAWRREDQGRAQGD